MPKSDSRRKEKRESKRLGNEAVMNSSLVEEKPRGARKERSVIANKGGITLEHARTRARTLFRSGHA